MDKLNILCNSCVHNDICKMRKEFIVFNAMATNLKATKHKDDTLRFPDFSLTVECSKYHVSGRGWGQESGPKTWLGMG